MALRKTKEAAERIGKSATWLEHARQTGDGPKYLKIGWNVFYRDEDIDEYLASKVRSRVWEFGDAAEGAGA
jgi:predicted DNA-binding transcriptional regulator AlpA